MLDRMTKKMAERNERGEKCCITCYRWKHVRTFRVDELNADGLTGACRECIESHSSVRGVGDCGLTQPLAETLENDTVETTDDGWIHVKSIRRSGKSMRYAKSRAQLMFIGALIVHANDPLPSEVKTLQITTTYGTKRQLLTILDEVKDYVLTVAPDTLLKTYHDFSHKVVLVKLHPVTREIVCTLDVVGPAFGREEKKLREVLYCEEAAYMDPEVIQDVVMESMRGVFLPEYNKHVDTASKNLVIEPID